MTSGQEKEPPQNAIPDSASVIPTRIHFGLEEALQAESVTLKRTASSTAAKDAQLIPSQVISQSTDAIGEAVTGVQQALESGGINSSFGNRS